MFNSVLAKLRLMSTYVCRDESCVCSRARTRPFIGNKSSEVTVQISTTRMCLQNFYLFYKIINAEMKVNLYSSFELKSESLVKRYQ
jgi:hypothetical protein